uniref:DevR family CRISPR-associated autoregulator n=2 Tax=candidate division WOR-3 bacterium TaxID=2052148 RepID=A0A7C1SE61_UNCW3
MIRFFTFAVKTQLNVHDLNNEAVAGNVQDIRIMEYLDEEGNRQEAPAVSGRMLKHWHYEAMRRLIINGNYSDLPLCDGCRAGEPIRPGKVENNIVKQDILDEQNAINNCTICDIHGYLIAKEGTKRSKEEGGDEAGVSARRSSRVMFSWLMPVLDSETVSRQVLHTRVSQQQSETGKGVKDKEKKSGQQTQTSTSSPESGNSGNVGGEESAQMLYNKSYASGIYAFVSAFDAARVGLVELELGSSGAEQKPKDLPNRIRTAIEAYRYLISGQMGASLSHALPHMNPRELLVCYSESGPLPFPVSPMYSDYITRTVGLMPEHAEKLYWGNDAPEGVNRMNSIDEIFRQLLAKV